MKRKALRAVGIGILVLALVMGISWYNKMRNCRTDPNWQIANEIYKVENALKEVDEDYECQFVSKATPFTYTDSEGNTIVYHCCQTAYVSNESGEYTGLDMNAIGLAIDVSQIKNRRECTVNEYDSVLCELGDRSYLCWTISPETSCVLEYNALVIEESEIIRMAESVPQLANE